MVSFRNRDVACLYPSSLQNVQGRDRIGIRFLIYSLYAWGVPMIILIIGIMRDKVCYWFLGMGYSVVLDACLITRRTGDDAASTPKTRQKKRKYCNQILSFQIPLKTDFSTWTELCYVSLFHPCSWEEHGVYMYYLMTHKFIIHMQMASLIYRLELSFSYFTFVKEMFLDCFGKGCIFKRKTMFHPYDDYSAELNSARE